MVSEQSTNRAVVLITDLHGRITGVSATIRNLVPLQSEQQNVKLWSRLPFAASPRLNVWQDVSQPIVSSISGMLGEIMKCCGRCFLN